MAACVIVQSIVSVCVCVVCRCFWNRKYKFKCCLWNQTEQNEKERNTTR